MLYVWGVAGLLGGDVLLRIEDHDRQRSRPEYEAAILRDVEWLGFEPSNEIRPLSAEFRQSDCEAVYAESLAGLAAGGRAYRCVCTRRMLASRAPAGRDGERAYPGLCRDARHPAGVPHGVRLAWEAGAAPEMFTDGLLGPQSQRPERQCGDLLLRDRIGQWTYQFAVTVDDIRHGIDFVVRGEDLLPSTGRQIRLARMLGDGGYRRYFHHPLVRDRDGVKLSKRQRPPAIRDLRSGGAAPEAVLGEAGRAAGLQPTSGLLNPSDAPGLVERRHGFLGGGVSAAGGPSLHRQVSAAAIPAHRLR